MKKYFYLCLVMLGLFSCKQPADQEQNDLAKLEVPQEKYESFGEQISALNSISAEEMKLKYEALKPGDTIMAKFSTTVNSVCKMKGCWMTLELPGSDEEPMVKFKDYGFFVPKDIEGSSVVVEGIAFIEETSVEDQKHFAKDAGRSKDEIDAIKETKKSTGFLAHGVLIKQ
ncbi:DUF4920 domain-containing protein [Gramella lutea]|uniref:DUF4920 domain-containing protein n=1 Tax=Christiangramia lutea TaxID=1607951 RepID=A0A9X2A9F9_9FLAO|nr:DUF4920 domain-containing protein [Christiangramia lutea]MCH4821637.1 DUF4920 domain-containing protein [Christiangramia lutea]